MDLVNINETYDYNDEPRYLTEDEITMVLDTLPSIMSPDKTTKENVDVALKLNLRNIFRANKLSPSSIQNIIFKLNSDFINATVIPGTTVGIDAAEGASRAPAQMSMDTFKNVGDSKAAAASVSEVEELVYVKAKRQYEICTLYYKNTYLTYAEVLESRKDIVECIISDIINNDYSIDTYKNLTKKWWHNDLYFTKILGNTLPDDEDYFMRLYLDVNKMYKFKITMKDIIEKIKEHNEDYQLYYGSIDDGIIDIHIYLKYIENKKSTIDSKIYDIVIASPKDRNHITDYILISSYYLNNLLPTIKKIKIKGISGITNLVPIIIPVLSVVLDEKKIWQVKINERDSDILILFELLNIEIYKEINDILFITLPTEYNTLTPHEYIDKMVELDKQYNAQKTIIKIVNQFKKYDPILVYSILLSSKKMRKYNITVDRFVKMFDLTNITLIHNLLNDDNIEIIVVFNNNDMTPRTYINNLIAEDEKNIKETKQKSTPLIDLSELITAEVSGTNLKGLMIIDFLDKTRLKSNNIHVMCNVLGVEAGQASFIEDLQQILSSYGLHPQHILTIAYLFFAKGIPTGAMYNSVNKPYGPLDKATVSKAVDILKMAALQGLNHEANGISTGIVLGLAPKVGTQYFNIGYETSPNKFVLNEDIYNKFKYNQNNIDDKNQVIMPINTENPNDDINNVITEKSPFVSDFIKAPLLGKKLGKIIIEPEPEIIEKSTKKRIQKK